ncbi:MAG: hypothetical protein SFY69_02490 [Planctomycetota bacterium]|nr:hypothetical protein [Planctomycetota bacterium]
MHHTFWRVVAVGIIGGTACAPWNGALAQDAPPTSMPVSPVRAAASTQTDLRAFTARSITRLALLDLRASPGALPADFAITADLLALAERHAPGDADIVRRRAEAAWNAGDLDTLLACTRRVIELDPADTVAQLRLITARIGRLQTVRERLAAYESFLGERGASLDASVRSRLALDAALLRRETGDDAGFVEHLRRALTLDATNKDAALLAYTYFSSRLDDRAGRVDLLSNLLMADPLDSRTLRLLRDEFAHAGAFESARRFHVIERAVETVAGRQPDDAFSVEGFVLDWMINGPASVSNAMDVQVESRRAEVAYAAQVDPTRLEGPNVLRPEDVRLDIPYEQVRALTLHLQGEEKREGLERSVADLGATVFDKMNALTDPTRRPPNITEAQAHEASYSVILEMYMLRCLVGAQTDEQMEGMNQVVASLQGGAADPRAVAANAWKAVRAGDYACGTQEFPPEQGSLWLTLARATARERTGDVRGAAALFREAAAMLPLNPLCAYAESRSRALGTDEARAREIADARAREQAIPGWVDQLVAAPRLSVSLGVDLEPRTPEPIEPVYARVRLRNVSPIPLGMGSARTLNTRFFFGPSLETGIRSRSDMTTGEVFELDRRLRLNPGEQLDVTLWPDVGLIGWLQEVGSDRPSRVRWRVIQGFESRSDGRRERGPGCVEATTNLVAREALPESRIPQSRLIARLEAPPADEAPALLVAARTRLMGGEPAAQPLEDPAPLVEALVKAYPTWPPAVRLLAVTVLPGAATYPVVTPLDEVMAQDTDPDVRMVRLVTRVTNPEDAGLVAATTSDIPALARVAASHRERLAAGRATLAHTGPVASPVRTPQR